jgi:hypothetical protein
MAVYGKNTVKSKWYPRNPEKYVGDVNSIIARSSWEIKFLNFCDMNPDVIRYNSEEIIIPYFDPVQNKMRRYFVDFWAEIRDKTGVIKKFLIEIKPDKFTKPPVQPKKKSKRYIEEAMQYATNCAKWKAADEVCKHNNVNFIILTENHLGIVKK